MKNPMRTHKEYLTELRQGNIKAYIIKQWPLNKTKVKQRRVDRVFSIDFCADDIYGCEYTHGIKGEGFDEDLVLVSVQYDYSEEDGGYVVEPVGLVTREALFLSTALLFMHSKATENFFLVASGILESALDPRSRNVYIETGGMTNADLYRLLCANYGYGGNNIIELSDHALVRFKDPGAFFNYQLLKTVIYSDEAKEKEALRRKKKTEREKEKIKKEVSDLPRLIKRYGDNIPVDRLIELINHERPPIGKEAITLIVNWHHQKDELWKMGSGGDGPPWNYRFLGWLVSGRQKEILQSLKTSNHPEAMVIHTELIQTANRIINSEPWKHSGPMAAIGRNREKYIRNLYDGFTES